MNDTIFSNVLYLTITESLQLWKIRNGSLFVLLEFLHKGDTVQTFDFCNSQPDVCQCIFVQIPMDNISKKISQTHQ